MSIVKAFDIFLDISIAGIFSAKFLFPDNSFPGFNLGFSVGNRFYDFLIGEFSYESSYKVVDFLSFSSIH